jgi:DNA modification methylase
VTSPPYSFAIDYLKGDKSQLEFLGANIGDLKQNMIGLRGKDGADKVSKYLDDMKKILREMHRVLKEDKFAVILIGTNTSQLLKISEYLNKVKLEDELVRIGQDAGFSLNQRIIRPIEGIRNSIRNEEILFLRK